VSDEPRALELRLDLDEEQISELERVLIKARAAELTEVRRRQVRFTAGYGDATTREVLDDERRRAQIRHDVLSTLLEALRARATDPQQTAEGADFRTSDVRE
jgi:hypothetical protein